MASLPYITEPGPKSTSVDSKEKGSMESTFCRLPLRKMAVFMRTPSTDKSSRFAANPRIMGLPPPCWLFWMNTSPD
ncbi:MAG: Uncharacterised protein [Flavobacteriia bacterium]|nr:MAG: Uncharacterised protein [Flavobacteriia bacterium]